MSAGEAYPAHRTGKAGAQVAQDLFSRAKSSVQAPVTQGCLLGWLHSKELPWVHHRGRFPQRAEQAGRGLTSWDQTEGGQVCLNTFRLPFQKLDLPRCCRYCTVLSWPFSGEFAFLDWSTSTCRAGTKPKNKVTGLLEGSSHRFIAPACLPHLGHLSHGAPSSHTG